MALLTTRARTRRAAARRRRPREALPAQARAAAPTTASLERAGRRSAADDAIERLGGIVERARWHDALVVMDANTREAAGARVLGERSARRRAASSCSRSAPGCSPATGEAERRARARSEPDTMPVAVGSGRDHRHRPLRRAPRRSRLHQRPTAASMDGYASSVAAMQLDGVKVTYPARAPAAIFADPRVAAAAPAELTRAGHRRPARPRRPRASTGWPRTCSTASRSRRGGGAACSSRCRSPPRTPSAVLAGDAGRDPGAARRARRSRESRWRWSATRVPRAAASTTPRISGTCWRRAGRRAHAPTGSRSATRRGSRCGCSGSRSRRRWRELPAPVALADPLGPAAREWLGEPDRGDRRRGARRSSGSSRRRPTLADWTRGVGRACAPRTDARAVRRGRARARRGRASPPSRLSRDRRARRCARRSATRAGCGRGTRRSTSSRASRSSIRRSTRCSLRAPRSASRRRRAVAGR